jgi:hypothetical protein
MPKDNSVDEFAQAVAALAPHAAPVAIERLALATRRLLESLADRAAVQSASAFMAAYQDLRNVDNNARMVAEEQEARLTAIEDHEGEATAPHTD